MISRAIMIFRINAFNAKTKNAIYFWLLLAFVVCLCVCVCVCLRLIRISRTKARLEAPRRRCSIELILDSAYKTAG